MPKVIVTCDRCGEEVHGLKFEGGTSGFYMRDSLWGKYMSDNERIVCDDCMSKCYKYRIDYICGSLINTEVEPTHGTDTQDPES